MAYAYAAIDAGDEIGFSRVTVTDAEVPENPTPAQLAQHQTVFMSNLAGQQVRMVDPNAGKTTTRTTRTDAPTRSCRRRARRSPRMTTSVA